MAYKFQIGAARLSGSIIQSDGTGDLRATTVDSLNASDGGIAAAGAVTGVTTLAASGLMSVASIELDDGSTIGPDSVADLITLSADGDFTFKDGAYDLNIASHDGTNGLALAGTIVSSTATELNLLDAITRGSIVYGATAGSAHLAKGAANTVLVAGASDVAYALLDNNNLAASAGIALTKLASINAGQILVGPNGNGPAAAVAMSGDAAISDAGAITLAAAQTNVQTITNAALVLSGNAGNKLDMTNATGAKFFIGGAEKMFITAAGVTVDGNFSVLGTTTTIDSTTINISRSFTFEGSDATDGFQTVLDSGLPTADTTVNLPTLGAGTYHLPVLADASTAASAAVTAAEFALLDGASANSSVAIADADQMIINDDGTMRQTAMSDIKAYVGAGAAETVKDLSGNNAPVAGVNFYGSDLGGGGVVITFPAASGFTDGQRIRIKAPSNCSNTNKVTINRSSTDTFDNTLESIALESPFAAVELVRVAAGKWRIF